MFLRAVLTIHRIQYVIFYQGKKQIILQKYLRLFFYTFFI